MHNVHGTITAQSYRVGKVQQYERAISSINIANHFVPFGSVDFEKRLQLRSTLTNTIPESRLK